MLEKQSTFFGRFVVALRFFSSSKRFFRSSNWRCTNSNFSSAFFNSSSFDSLDI